MGTASAAKEHEKEDVEIKMKFQTLDAKTLQVESLLRKMNKFIEGNGGAAGINSRAKRRQVGRKPRVEEILR